MSLLMMRAAILAQGGDAAPPNDIGSAWELDTTRRAAGYTLSDSNQTALNTSGGTNYQRWVPSAKAILPSDGRRYWEVLCAASRQASPHRVTPSRLQAAGSRPILRSRGVMPALNVTECTRVRLDDRECAFSVSVLMWR